MELISINLKNFKQYINQKIEFGTGLTGIIGKNGSGKSSIFDAILTAFFGTGTVSKEFLRSTSRMENEPVNIELILEKSGKIFRIIREYRGKNLTAHAQLFINDELKASTHGAVNEEVAKIIGMDKDSFSMSVFAGQKELGAISSVTGTPRRELIRRMTGMDKLDKVQLLVRTDRNNMKNELKGQENILLNDEEKSAIEKQIFDNSINLKKLEDEIKKTAEELELANKSYTDAKKKFDELESAKNKFTSADKLLTMKNESLKNNTISKAESIERLSRLKQDEDELKKIKTQENLFHKLLIDKERMDNEAGKYARFEQITLRIDSITKEISEKNKTVNSLSEKILQKAELEKERDFLLKKRIDLNNLLSQKRSDMDKLNTAKGNIEGLINDRLKNIELIKKAGKDSSCPTCFRPLLDAYDSTIKKLNDDLELYNGKEINEIKISMKTFNKEISDIENNISELDKKNTVLLKNISAFNEKENQMKALSAEILNKKAELENLIVEQEKYKTDSYDKSKHDTIKKNIHELTHIHEKFIRLSRMIEDIPAIEKKIIQIDIENNLISDEIIKLNDEIKSIPYSEKKYSDARSNREKHENLRDQVKSRYDNKEKEKTLADLKLKEFETKIDEDCKRRASTDNLRIKMIQLDKFDIYLDGFKKVALDRVRPLITKFAGDLFNDLTRGRYQSILLDDNFDFFIIDEGRSFPISRFSGGEIDLANLCLRIAISRTISDISGAENAGFLAFDEIFGSQDDERRGEILNAFHRLQEMYRQIFIISHIDEIKADFPRLLEISRGIEGSEVRTINI